MWLLLIRSFALKFVLIRSFIELSREKKTILEQNWQDNKTVDFTDRTLPSFARHAPFARGMGREEWGSVVSRLWNLIFRRKDLHKDADGEEEKRTVKTHPHFHQRYLHSLEQSIGWLIEGGDRAFYPSASILPLFLFLAFLAYSHSSPATLNFVLSALARFPACTLLSPLWESVSKL